MTKEEKIAAIVEANLESMDLKDLERYYIDTQVFEIGRASCRERVSSPV